ncbi:hypothetical protein [Tateyamaria sp. SN3-11]|uniref:hypothetical protein n=1 Tax=Tateyamaria sp. SN3-11 TaxID=3092147 RepID=UPI0039EC5353
MMNWMLELIGGSDVQKTARGGEKKPRVTRQEVATLFADDLARPALQKRAKTRFGKPRHLMAGRQPQFA